MATSPTDHGQSVVFFTICTADFFLGLVALINSLRLVGHTERIVVLDCGMRPDQVALLQGHCDMVRPPPVAVSNAAMFKAFGHNMNPDGIAVVIDSDAIVTSRLDKPIGIAREGKVCVCNDPEIGRWFQEWSEIFDLQAPLRREPYVNSALVVLSNRHWPDLLRRWNERCSRIADRPTIYEGAANTDPVQQADQDVLNAMLMSEIPPAGVHRLSVNQVAHCSMQKARVVDVATLASVRNGEPTLVLHWPGRPKPWNWQGWREWRGISSFSCANPFVVLLRRLLTGDEIAVKVPPAMLPGRLAPGRAGELEFAIIGASARIVFDPARWLWRVMRGRQP
jgi:hypothetical protein